MPTSRLDIDLSAIERNLGVVRGITAPGGASPEGSRPRVSVCAVLKQDAYGTGAARVGKRLGAAGADCLAVYTLDEARALAEAVPNLPILLLMPVFGLERSDTLYRHAAAGRLHYTIHNADQLIALTETAVRFGMTIPVHVQADTGLSRGGSMPETAKGLVERVIGSPRLRLAGLMTHFASPCCDEQFTREQAKHFREFVQGVAAVIKTAGSAAQPALHAANSCATFRSRTYHGTMVRVGQSLLGYGAEDVREDQPFEFRSQFQNLDPSVRWTTGVVNVQEIPAGWPVGYGSTWRAPLRTDGRKTRIALLPVGYADGYPRSLGGVGRRATGGNAGTDGAGWIGFTGRSWERRGAGEAEDAGKSTSRDGSALPTVYAPVVGRVSMDQITVDVTDVPEQYLRFHRLATEMLLPEAEVYGRTRGAPNFLPALSHAAGTITHDLLCRVGARVERVYRSPGVAHERVVAPAPRWTVGAA